MSYVEWNDPVGFDLQQDMETGTPAEAAALFRKLSHHDRKTRAHYAGGCLSSFMIFAVIPEAGIRKPGPREAALEIRSINKVAKGRRYSKTKLEEIGNRNDWRKIPGYAEAEAPDRENLRACVYRFLADLDYAKQHGKWPRTRSHWPDHPTAGVAAAT